MNTLKTLSFALAASGMTAMVAMAQQAPTSPEASGQNPAQTQTTQTAPADRMPNNPKASLTERILNRDLTAQEFVSDAAMGGMKEVRLSQLALEKSQNPQVKEFANRMVTDHSAANTKLQQIAMSEKLEFPAANTFAKDDPNWNSPMLTGSEQIKDAYLLTTNFPVADYEDFKMLKSLNGREFDNEYAKDMVSDHVMTIREFEFAHRYLTDPQLKQFATQTLPTLRMHSQMAQRLSDQLMGTPMAENTHPSGQLSSTTK